MNDADLSQGSLARSKSVGSVMKELGEKDPFYAIWKARNTLMVPPTWQAPTERCGSCGRAFGLLVRHHHCRNCGLDRCGWCCGHFTDIPQLGFDSPVRVCSTCFLLISQEKRKDALLYTLRPLIAKGALLQAFCLTKFLMPGVLIDAADDTGRTAVMEAALHGIPEVFLPLLHDFSANTEVRDHEGRTLLMYAAVGGVPLIVKQVLDCKNTEIDATDLLGRTALDHARKAGHEEVADLLLTVAARQGKLRPQRKASSSTAHGIGRNRVVQSPAHMEPADDSDSDEEGSREVKS